MHDSNSTNRNNPKNSMWQPNLASDGGEDFELEEDVTNRKLLSGIPLAQPNLDLDEDILNWQQRLQTKPSKVRSTSNRTRIYLLIGIIGLVALIAFFTMLVVLLSSSSPKNNVATANLSLVATPTPVPVATSTIVVATSAPAVIATPTALPLSTPTAVVISEAERLYNYGKTAFDKMLWAEAIEALEKLNPGDAGYSLAQAMLVKAYFNQAQALLEQENTLDSARKVMELYHKIQAKDTNYPELQSWLDKADLYLQVRTQYEADQCEQVLTQLNLLYTKVKSENAAARYRDTAELYYNCLVVTGSGLLDEKKYIEAKERFKLALTLDVGDKSAAQTKLNETEQKINPPTLVSVNAPRKTVAPNTPPPSTPPPPPPSTPPPPPPPPSTPPPKTAQPGGGVFITTPPRR